jgi:hypothetical protein
MMLGTPAFRARTRLSVAERGDADEEHESFGPAVRDAVRHTRRRPDDAPLGRRLAFVADDEVPHSLDDEVELVLAGVIVELLLLPRCKAVQPQHQALAAPQRGLERLVGAGADVIAVVREIGHRVLE